MSSLRIYPINEINLPSEWPQYPVVTEALVSAIGEPKGRYVVVVNAVTVTSTDPVAVDAITYDVEVPTLTNEVQTLSPGLPWMKPIANNTSPELQDSAVISGFENEI